MGNICFYAMFFVIFLQFTFGAIKFSGVNRTFLSMYKGVFEVSLITIDDDGEPVYPYYGDEILKENVDSYLKANLTKYTKNYETNIRYLNLDNDGVCLEDRCSRVEVNLKADINMFFKYDKSLEYTVKEAIKNE